MQDVVLQAMRHSDEHDQRWAIYQLLFAGTPVSEEDLEKLAVREELVHLSAEVSGTIPRDEDEVTTTSLTVSIRKLPDCSFRLKAKNLMGSVRFYEGRIYGVLRSSATPGATGLVH